MPGVAGKSGGRRDGAGRPPAKVSIRAGQQFFAQWDTPEGRIEIGPKPAEVIEITRTTIIIQIGDNTITLRR